MYFLNTCQVLLARLLCRRGLSLGGVFWGLICPSALKCFCQDRGFRPFLLNWGARSHAVWLKVRERDTVIRHMESEGRETKDREIENTDIPQKIPDIPQKSQVCKSVAPDCIRQGPWWQISIGREALLEGQRAESLAEGTIGNFTHVVIPWDASTWRPHDREAAWSKGQGQRSWKQIASPAGRNPSPLLAVQVRWAPYPFTP